MEQSTVFITVISFIIESILRTIILAVFLSDVQESLEAGANYDINSALKF